MTKKDFSEAAARLQQEADRKTDVTPDPRPLIRSVQHQIEAIARGDFDAVLSQALPDVTLDIFAPPEFAWIRQARGLTELRRALEENFGSVDEQRPTISNVFTEGDAVVLFGREQGRIRATGQRYDVEFVQTFAFRDERLAGIRVVAAYTTAASRPK